MRIGFALPQVGSIAGPQALERVAARAEELEFDSLWVLDRLLFPTHPRAPYPAGDGTLPTPYKRVLDPVGTLTFVAARTDDILIGTSVLNMPWYNPALLARQLSTLDVLSNGRLRVGLGMGWSPDEYEAAGTPWQERGKRADEFVRALKAIWTTDPVDFDGEYFRIPPSFISLKPVQVPHPPIYMAAFTPPALQRVAREADGWFPAGIPISGIAEMFDGLGRMSQEAGRDPASLELIVRGNVAFSSTPAADPRADFSGTLEQIAQDVVATKNMGASELVLDVQFSSGVGTVEDILEKMEELRSVARQT